MDLKKIYQPQLPMKRVLYSLIPIMLFSIYLFGWRVLLLLIINNVVGFFVEYLFVRKTKKKVSQAVFVTATLFTFTLPPMIPFWISIVGIIVAVVFGKMAFGGFGKNIFNPAIAGRAFIYVSFGTFLTSGWTDPLKTLPGALLKYTTDAVSSATPLKLLGSNIDLSYLDMFLGFYSGSIGATSFLLIVLGGIYLIWKKAANWRNVVSCFGSFLFFQSLFWFIGIDNAGDPLAAMLTGGFAFGAFYMVTDPISSAKTNTGRVWFGIMVGFFTVLIRIFANWPEGMMFAILLGNMFSPIIDYMVKENKKKKKVVA